MQDYQQFDYQLKSIATEKDSLKRNPLLLELAVLLLKEVQLGEQEIQAIVANDDLVSYLIKIVALFKAADGFMVKMEETLPVSALQNNIATSITQLRQRLAAVQPTIENIKEANAELLATREQLVAEEGALQKLEAEVQELTVLKQKTTPENMERLRLTAQQLEIDTSGKREELAVLEQKKAELDVENRRVTELVAALKGDTSDSISRLNSIFTELQQQPSNLESIDKQLVAANQYLQSLMHKYSEITLALEECHKAIAETVEAEQNNREIFKIHFSANDAIIGSMQKCKIAEEVTRPQIVEIRGLSTRIASDLSHFDVCVDKLVAAQEDARKNIRMLAKC